MQSTLASKICYYGVDLFGFVVSQTPNLTKDDSVIVPGMWYAP